MKAGVWNSKLERFWVTQQEVDDAVSALWEDHSPLVGATDAAGRDGSIIRGSAEVAGDIA
jgi:hypothetical protein